MKNKGLVASSLGALGVVFGDIGTSPLYAINEIFHISPELLSNPQTILGPISLVVWAIISVIFIKYLFLVLRADNEGEGGVFALYGLLYPHRKSKKSVAIMLIILVLSAGLFLGNGIFTPAISVLSAVEGIRFWNPNFASSTVFISVIILSALFFIQKQGTRKVGYVFGPVLLVWFFCIGFLGLVQIIKNPEVLSALNPLIAAKFLIVAPLKTSMLVFGGVILSITGGEALYADIGHFSKKSIKMSWVFIVFPALILNYLGQGAFLISGQSIREGSLFYSLVPAEFIGAMIIIATFATVIASQALISGVFSLATQGVALGLIPRIKIRYTHHSSSGQTYIPLINWLLFFGCIGLVYFFGTSTKMATAYGLAVAGDMLITSIAMVLVSLYLWKWSLRKALSIFSFFIILDSIFLISNSFKFFEGGYIPFIIGFLAFSVMRIWRWGRRTTFSAYSGIQTPSIRELIELKSKTKSFLEKNMILMVPKPIHSIDQNTPALMKMIFERHGTLAKNIIFVQVVHKKVPFLLYSDRYEIHTFDKSEFGMISSVTIKFGFMEEPNVEKVLEDLARHREINLDPDPKHWIVHLSQENIVRPAEMNIFKTMRYSIYSLLRQISFPAYRYYGLGEQVNLSVEIIPVKA